jgi:hypothetical protein
MAKVRNTQKLAKNHHRKKSLGRPRHGWGDDMGYVGRSQACKQTDRYVARHMLGYKKIR